MDIAHLRGRLAAMRGDARVAAETLEQAAAAIEARNSEKAALILADAVEPWLEADRLDRAEAVAAKAWELDWPCGGATEIIVTLRYADVRGWLGDVESATQLWLQAADIPTADDPSALREVAEALFSAADDERARTVAERAVQVARKRSALGVLTYALEGLALIEARSGRLRDAEEVAAEAVDLATALGRGGERLATLGVLSWIEAMLGREQSCRAHLAEVFELKAELGFRASYSGYGNVAAGLLALSLGEAEQAVADFERESREVGVRVSADAFAPRSFVLALVEAYVRVGRQREAAEALRVFEDAARRSARPIRACARSALPRSRRVGGAVLPGGAGPPRAVGEPVRAGAHTPALRRAAPAGKAPRGNGCGRRSPRSTASPP